MTSLSLQKKKGEFDDKSSEAIRKAIEETVTYDGDTHFHYEDDTLIECDIATRWNVPTEALQTIAKANEVNIRAVGREDAMGFVQVVCINDKGDVVQDEEIDYAF